MQEYLTQVTAIKPLTLDIVELQVQLVLPAELSYEAGQFMEFKIGTEYRCYSLATPPVIDNLVLTFCVKLEPQGLGSNFVRKLQVGSEVVMRGPNGFFVVKDFEQPVALVATGVGVAPFAAIVPDLLVHGYKQDLQLLFGVRNEENVFYFERFSQWAKHYDNFHFTPLLSRPQSHWPGQTGYVTTEIQVNYAQLKDHFFYLCGNKSMTAEVRHLLLQLGHNARQIQEEIFF